MTAGALVSLLIYLVVIALLVALCLWVLQQIGIPEPLGRFIRIAVIAIACLIVILLLLGLIGAGPFVVARP